MLIAMLFMPLRCGSRLLCLKIGAISFFCMVNPLQRKIFAASGFLFERKKSFASDSEIFMCLFGGTSERICLTQFSGR